VFQDGSGNRRPVRGGSPELPLGRLCQRIGTRLPFNRLLSSAKRAARTPHKSPSVPRFPPRPFESSLTLFSKCFSSFPHGTCSLSVSRLYGAEDGRSHPVELQSQTTRLVEPTGSGPGARAGPDGILTLSDVRFHGTEASHSGPPATRYATIHPNRRNGGTVLGLSSSRFTRRY
jgi:hypothetical protein